MKTAAVVALKKEKETHQEVAADGGQRRHQKVCYDNVKTHRMGTGLQPSRLSCWQQLQGLASARGKSGFQLRRKPALSSGLRLAWQGGRLRQSTAGAVPAPPVILHVYHQQWDTRICENS